MCTSTRLLESNAQLIQSRSCAPQKYGAFARVAGAFVSCEALECFV